MKINVNAIGLGEAKWLKLGEGLISGGLVVVVAGVAVTVTGLIIIKKSQCWTIGNTQDHIEYFKTIIDKLDSAFK